MSALFNLGHIAKLHEIQKAHLKAGLPGIGREVEELISRLENGGVGKSAGDPRIAQAKKLWDLGFGRELKMNSFHAYFATIPEIPKSLVADNPVLPLLVLVDPRLGHTRSCRLDGLRFAEYGWDDTSLVPFDDRHVMPSAPYWVRAHDGSPNLGKKPSDCRAKCTGKLYAGTADVGIAIWIQHGKCNHVMDLPGSVHISNRESCACLGVWRGGLELGASRHDVTNTLFGSVVFVRE